jgi:hypothetical protein
MHHNKIVLLSFKKSKSLNSFGGQIIKWLRTHPKFQNPRTSPFRRGVKNGFNSGHYVLPAMPKGNECTALRPKESPCSNIKETLCLKDALFVICPRMCILSKHPLFRYVWNSGKMDKHISFYHIGLSSETTFFQASDLFFYCQKSLAISYYFVNGSKPNCFFLQIEDDLNIFFEWRMNSIFFVWKTTTIFL